MPTTDELLKRRVRYSDLKPCYNAFIDTRTPGSEAKENFTIIGPGVSENPDQFVHIEEPHGFNIGGARQPPGCVNSQHSHDTAEVFIAHSGRWRFDLGEHGDDARVTLEPGDAISIPTGIFRGFTNIGRSEGYLFAVLGEDNPGRVMWAPHVFEMAQKYGLVLLETGRLIDSTKGEVIPEGANLMKPPNSDQLKSMKAISQTDAESLVWRSPHQPSGSSEIVIGSDGFFKWPHGFTMERIGPVFQSSSKLETKPYARVLFVHNGEVVVTINGHKIPLGTGDTYSVPAGMAHKIEANEGTLLFVIDRVNPD